MFLPPMAIIGLKNYRKQQADASSGRSNTGTGTRTAPQKNKLPKTQYFSRYELGRILNLYALRVAEGDWRDYALDHHDNMAVFSIYKSSNETPLFTIEKHKLKGKDRWRFILRDRKKLLLSAYKLQDILDYMSKRPRLVKIG